MTLRLNRELGLLVGTFSGANVVCDGAERYFSPELFQDAAK